MFIILSKLRFLSESENQVTFFDLSIVQNTTEVSILDEIEDRVTFFDLEHTTRVQRMEIVHAFAWSKTNEMV